MIMIELIETYLDAKPPCQKNGGVGADLRSAPTDRILTPNPPRTTGPDAPPLEGPLLEGGSARTKSFNQFIEGLAEQGASNPSAICHK
jgi:hypothetical protein